jgi:hypothetical protein
MRDLTAGSSGPAGLPLYTRNPYDFPELVGVVEIVAVQALAWGPELTRSQSG